MPWVKGMRKSKVLTNSGGWVAQRRTQHLKHVLSKSGHIKTKEEDDLIGNIWCKVFHPITYITGRIIDLFNSKTKAT